MTTFKHLFYYILVGITLHEFGLDILIDPMKTICVMLLSVLVYDAWEKK